MTQLNNDIISLLQLLVQTRSYSGEESQTADHIQHWLAQRGITTSRLHNNVIAKNLHYQDDLPTVILNSHHDTVFIGGGWTKDPLGAQIDGDRLYGRGSNDAGGSLVALIGTFTLLYKAELPYNLVLIASAEEENFG
ncbi:MAG: M20/M25/M40 family metallo-hydrolase, partial [Bacteroidota bacterium]